MRKLLTEIIADTRLDLQAALIHLQRTLLGAAETAHQQLALLEHQVGGRGVVEVQVPQDVAVVVQHARPEGSADVRAALLTLSRAGAPATQCQVRSHLAPAGSIATGQTGIVMFFSPLPCLTVEKKYLQLLFSTLNNYGLFLSKHKWKNNAVFCKQ